MGMTIDDCIHKLDFSIGAYQRLIDENVSNGEVVGTGVRGTWTASTSLNKAYSDMIEALQTAKDTMHKYQLMQADYEKRLKADMMAMLTEIQLEIDEIPINADNSEPFKLGQASAYDKCENLIYQKIDTLKSEVRQE